MSIHSIMTLFSKGDMMDGEEKGIDGVAAPLETGSQGLDVFRPIMCQTNGLVRARPGWTNLPIRSLSRLPSREVINC